MMGDMNCGISGLTTPLTIYGFGLRGNSAFKSTRKHRFRTKKHQKDAKITQKIGIVLFGTSMPQVRILSLRPKNRKERLILSFLFFRLKFTDLNLLKRTALECFAQARQRGTAQRGAKPGSESCHSDHIKTIRTFSYLESRSDYLFYLSIPTLIARNENGRYHGLLTMVSAFALLKNTQIYDIIKIISNQNPFSVT